MTMKTSRKVALLLAVVVLAALGWWLAQRSRPASGPASAVAAPAAASSPRAALTVTVTTPRSGSWPIVVAADGSIAAWQEAVIGAELQGLRIAELLVNVGDRVRRGQLLARLRSDTVGADAAMTRANLAEAKAARDEAAANAARARALQPAGAISAQELQQRLTAEQTARARIAALEARLAADEVRLSLTRITAPDDGIISARAATVGSVVQPGQELFRLIRQGRLEWRGEVAAADLPQLKPGMGVEVTPAGGRAVQGRLRMVAPTVDAATRNGLAYVDLPNPGDARPGMFGRGRFEVGTGTGLTLPQSAVLLRDGLSYVMRLRPDGRVEQVKVATGRRSGDRIAISSGLDAGDRVVEQGGGFLADGDSVRVVNAPAAAPAPAASAASR